MGRQSFRRVRIVGGVLAGAVLAAALLLPGAALAQDESTADQITRNCNNPESVASQTQCSFNVANPSGTQEVRVYGAPTGNSAETEQELEQRQYSTQVGVSVVENDAVMRDIGGEATLVVRSGNVEVEGNSLELDLSGLRQIARADPQGTINQTVVTGSADTSVSGNTSSAGGDASATQNSVSAIVGVSDLSANANRLGGGGGDQEGVTLGGSGGSNLAAAEQNGGGNVSGDRVADAAAANTNSEAASLADSLGIEVIDASFDATDNLTANANASAGGATSPNGGSLNLSQEQNAGTGGDANSGAAGNGGQGILTPTLNQLTGNPNSQAWGSAQGGNANSSAVGHYVLGGVSGNNVTSASMNGGLASNGLSLSINQSGNVAGSSGDVTNNGGYATAPVNATIDQRSNATNNQTQNPNQQGTNSSTTTQTASSGDQNVNPSQNVRSGQQEASGSNSRSVEIEHSLNDNFSERDHR